jgi:hypothetical protein
MSNPLEAGRNILHMRNGTYRVTSAIADTDCVIGASFGYRKDRQGVRTPGIPNISLAEYARMHLLGRMFILQSDLAAAFNEDIEPDHVVLDDSIDPGLYSFVEQAATIVQADTRLKLKRAVLLGHPRIMPRFITVAKDLGLDAVAPTGLPEVWDPQSYLEHHRSEREWVGHETFILGIKSLLNGGKS